MDSLQASLEAESRAKAEALRIKKKLESDINELEIALDHANKANSEAHKSIKRYQGQLRDVEGPYEEETRQRRDLSEKAGLADRRANALQGELEEARALLDSADRGKKQADMELVEARAAVNDMSTINSKASSDKRRIEGAIHTMHAEIDDMLHQAKNSEEKAKKAMVDAARLADELRAEQEHATTQEKAKRSLESQIAELEQRLAEAKAKLVRPSRDSKRLSAVSRSSNSNKMKTTRIKIVCLNLLASFNKRSRPTRSKLKKLKKLQLLTWPNIAKLNKSLKRLRSVPNWLEMLSLLPVQPPLVSKLKEFKDFAPLSSSSKHQRPTNKFLGTTGSQDVPRAIVDSVWQLKYKQEQLQGLNLQKCPIEHHVLNCIFFSCLNMKYTACK